jgi:hypothetical protein
MAGTAPDVFGGPMPEEAIVDSPVPATRRFGVNFVVHQ